MPFGQGMTLRTLALALPLIAACAAAPTSAPVDPAVARARTLCADEHPLDEAARVACERTRAPRVARAPVASGFSSSNEGSTVVVLLPASGAGAGQGLVDYGRQLAAPPIRCTTIGFGSFARTTCR